jgi:hypothetical protein
LLRDGCEDPAALNGLGVFVPALALDHGQQIVSPMQTKVAKTLVRVGQQQPILDAAPMLSLAIWPTTKVRCRGHASRLIAWRGLPLIG